MRAGLDTPLAPDAFGLIDSSDVAVVFVYKAGARWAVLHANGRDTLATYGHDNIVWILGKGRRIPYYLNPGKRRIRYTLVGNGTGEHTALTAKA